VPTDAQAQSFLGDIGKTLGEAANTALTDFLGRRKMLQAAGAFQL
jgi:hypothetical protein